MKPEPGLEVICTGRITTYPGSSRYQLIVEQMELAGLGALMALLEERARSALPPKGLFDAARKKKLPFLPEVIGVITSPTGAVIRDIMHRLNARVPAPGAALAGGGAGRDARRPKSPPPSPASTRLTASDCPAPI